MFTRLKEVVKSNAALLRLRKIFAFAVYEVRDVFDSYLSRSPSSRRTPQGFYLRGSSSAHHVAMQVGSFEPEETALFSKLLRASDVFVDIGANIGFYTCLARSLGNHVIAVEPLEHNLSLLFENIQFNDWADIEVFPLGVSERAGLATLYGASSTGASLLPKWAGASRRFKRTIALSTLDIVLGTRFPGQRLFIKIDVEGAEFEVLLGAKQTLAAELKPVWVVEICFNEFHPEGHNPHFLETFELFWDLGYEARTANSENRLITQQDVARWKLAGVCDSGSINYLFARSVD